jgi:hypothetical protein
MKKKLVVVFLVSLLSAAVLAAIPQQINYQGQLKNSSGAPLIGNYSMVFTIYDAATSGTNLWSETQTVSCDAGLFNVLLGSVTPVSTEVFSGADRWLGVKVESDAEMTPRQKLVSVGNAFQANNADNLGGQPASYYAAASGSQWTTSGSNIYNANSGNVGIGINNPSTPLDIYTSSNTNNGPLRIRNNYNGSSAYTEMALFNDTGTSNGLVLGLASSGAGGGANRGYFWLRENSFLQIGTNNTERIRIASDGNVGIGTTAPSNPLHVSNAGEVVARFQSTGTHGGIDIDSVTGCNSHIHFDENNVTKMEIGYSASKGYLYLGNAGTDAGVINLKSAGNVGIGTTSPGSLLQVGNGGATGKATINSQDAAFGQLQIGCSASGGQAALGFISGVTAFGSSPTSTNGDAYIWAIGPNVWGIGGNSFGIGNKATGGSIFTIQQSGGNVGIGTTAPAATFEVGTNHTLVVNAGTGRVGIGTTAPVTLLDLAGVNRQVERISSYSSTYTDYRGNAAILFQKSHSDTLGTLATTLNGEELGALEFQAVGSDNVGGAVAKIMVAQAGSAASGGSWHTPGKMVFYLTNASSPGNTITPLVLDYNGNVGIGTAAPGYTFEVNGIINATDYRKGGNLLGVWPANGSNIYYNAGNVGIGTTSPSYKLSVLGGANDGIKITVPDGTSNNAQLVFSAGNEPQYGQGAIIQLNAPSSSVDPNTVLLFNRTNGPLMLGTNNSEKVRILASGNVGIGTTAPGYTLEVNGIIHSAGSNNGFLAGNYSKFIQDASNNTVLYNMDGGGGAFWFATYIGGQFRGMLLGNSLSTLNGGSGAHNLGFDLSDGSIYFNALSSNADARISRPATSSLAFDTGGTERMRINASGNVGIGTTNPGQTLTLQRGDGDGNVVLSINNTSGTLQGVVGVVGTANDWAAPSAAGDLFIRAQQSLQLATSGSGVTRMTIASGGSVGIGTTSPAATFEVGTNHTLVVNAGSGNVGIGTTNPRYKLHVRPATDANLHVRAGSDWGGGTGVALQSANDADSGSLMMRIAANPLILDSNVGVGIGTTNPTRTLEVNGIVKATSFQGSGAELTGITNYTAAPSAISVPASGTAYQNTTAYPASVIVSGGTVSLIEFSRDGSTFYDVGAISGMFTLSPNDYLRVTYSSLPTMTFVPR